MWSALRRALAQAVPRMQAGASARGRKHTAALCTPAAALTELCDSISAILAMSQFVTEFNAVIRLICWPFNANDRQ